MMPKIQFLGRVLPEGIKISAQAPELKWKWEEENLEPTFRVKIINSNITVECDIEKYEPKYNSELYKRASDLARTSANMVAFATGYGIIVMIETLIDPTGSILALNRQEPVPASSRTAFTLDATNRVDFDSAFRVVLAEPAIFIALDDLIRAVTSHHTQLADCGRVVDCIRRIIAPTLDGTAAWREMHQALNIARPYQDWISKQSTGSRHGDPTFVPPGVGSEAIQRTWAIMNRLLEYGKGGNKPLTPPEFPQLV